MEEKRKKILLTGGTGLIGQHCILPLVNNGFEVYRISQRGIKNTNENVHNIKADLFNPNDISNVLSKVKPEYLLHLAWYTGEGYLESEKNQEFLKSSLHLLECFKNNGGQRAIFAGTCFEYEFSGKKLNEFTSMLNPVTTYAKCKHMLNINASSYSKLNGISFGWGRIFYVYGPCENKHRLTPYIIDSLNNNKKAFIKSGKLIKDYMYSGDIAEAFVEFIKSDVEGNVNICTSNPISVKDFVLKIAQKLKKEHLIVFNDDDNAQPPVIVGDNSRLLKEIGYKIKYSFDDAIDKILTLNISRGI